MNQTKRRHTLLYVLWLACLAFVFPQVVQGAGKETTFRITVLKSSGQPQPGMVLKIASRSQEYIGDAQGLITFNYEIEENYTRRAYLYFPSDRDKSVASFTLEPENTAKTFYIDSPQDIVAFKQSQQTFPVEGIVTDDSDNPIMGAVISIQGTGRKTVSDEIGLFRIDADFNHPVTVRVAGMENQSIPIQSFLQNPNEPYTIRMYHKNPSRIYSSVERMPEFPGGMKAFQRYLKRNLKYPPQAKRDSIEGVVAIQFVVERNGRITSPVIVRSLEASMDTVALEVIRNMPRWIPAKDHGITVRCKYSVPVQFKIERPKPIQPTPVLAKGDSLMRKDSLRLDSLRIDSLGVDSLLTDSLRPIRKLLADSLRGDSLRLEKDSLHMFADSLRLKKDSLLLPADSLTIRKDSLIVRKDSLAQQATDKDVTPEKPKKRNLFVRFFRWLFGIKDK